jgi:hypothetical protein
MTDLPKLAYSIQDLVRLSGLGRSFIYEQINSGSLKVKKAGSRTVILAHDARAWLDALPDLYKRAES